MTGSEFKRALRADKRTIENLAELLGVSRGYTYYLFRQKEIPEKFVLKSRAIGIKFQNDEIHDLKERIAFLELQVSALKRRLSQYVKVE